MNVEMNELKAALVALECSEWREVKHGEITWITDAPEQLSSPVFKMLYSRLTVQGDRLIGELWMNDSEWVARVEVSKDENVERVLNALGEAYMP